MAMSMLRNALTFVLPAVIPLCLWSAYRCRRTRRTGLCFGLGGVCTTTSLVPSPSTSVVVVLTPPRAFRFVAVAAKRTAPGSEAFSPFVSPSECEAKAEEAWPAIARPAAMMTACHFMIVFSSSKIA
jgi:hypothetical protein